jgi:hypothetical protein
MEEPRRSLPESTALPPSSPYSGILVHTSRMGYQSIMAGRIIALAGLN